jgi:hypothetical protein
MCHSIGSATKEMSRQHSMAPTGPPIEPRSKRRLAVGAGDMDAEIPALEDMLPTLSLKGGISPRQPFRIAFIGEKSSLGEVLRPIAKEVGAELLLSSGDCSETHIAEMAKRAADDGRPFVVLYFSDFDPGGWGMPIGVARKFQAHRDLRYPNLDVQVHNVALTHEQVREFNLPSTPLKEKERRAAAWRAKWGHDQTEIDALAALRPDLLEQIARDALRPFYDQTLMDRIAAANTLPPEATVWFEALPEYTDAVTALTERHSLAETAAEAVNDEKEYQFQMLQEAVGDAADAPKLPFVEIEPAITAKAPEPLFSTADDFVDASRKLVARKRLIDQDDEILPA